MQHEEPKPHTRRAGFRFQWPREPLHIVLVRPEIPPNTGSIARLCAATGAVLHLVEPLGFRIGDAALRRAGLDYWDRVVLVRHPSLDEMEQALSGRRLFLFSCGAGRCYTEPRYRAGDALVFGCESRGLSDEFLARHRDRVVGMPMTPDGVRSINLAVAAGVALYEALRQIDAATRPGSDPAEP